MATINIPELLIPNPEVDFRKWAVIACDQFTSQPDYWRTLDAFCGDVSTLRVILPEYYLSAESPEEISDRISRLHATMESYIDSGIYKRRNGFVLVERRLPTGGVRLGLMVAIDLEDYEYHIGNTARIRATEATVESRLPIRVRIRSGARMEFTHALMLVDDRTHGVIEQLYDKRGEMPVLYDFELNMGGGHLTGYGVPDSDSVLESLNRVVAGRQFQYAIGDGNHSIAAAKQNWERIKQSLTPAERESHPARFCTCELVNLNSEGLVFHPIHRVVFGTDGETFIREFSQFMQGTGRMELIYNGNRVTVECPDRAIATYELTARFMLKYTAAHADAQVDYIHGEAHLEAVAKDLGGVGLVMPTIPKQELFPYIENNGVLPKKAFSLGEAEEKRYYLEGKIIK